MTKCLVFSSPAATRGNYLLSLLGGARFKGLHCLSEHGPAGARAVIEEPDW